MSPGTFINPWQDLSSINQAIPVESVSYRPLIMVASSFDKGPENMTRCYGDEFFKLYGQNPPFAKHGQAGIQSTQIALAGAELLVKRMVAEDAELANLILAARISEVKSGSDTDESTGTGESEISAFSEVGEKEATPDSSGVTGDADSGTTEDTGDAENTGATVDIGDGSTVTGSGSTDDTTEDPEKTEGTDTTTDPSGTGSDNKEEGDTPTTPTDPTPETPVDPVTPEEPEEPKSYSIRWEALSIEGCRSYDEVYKAAMALHTENKDLFPLIIVTDNGRGISTKSVKLTPTYEISKGYGITFYTLRVFEGTTEIDKQTVTFNPDVVINKKAYGMYHQDTSKQVKTTVDSDLYEEFVTALADKLCVPPEDLQYQDLINARTFKGLGLENLEIAEDSVDIDAMYGVALKDGSNGSFDIAPIKSEALTNAYIRFFSGEETDEIYDLNIHKICGIFDANYPVPVKEAIAKWVSFREDMFFFRDLGTDIRSYLDIISALAENTTKNKFIADYMTSYMIYEPTTQKRVEVSMMYDFAPAMVRLFAKGAYVPTAGTVNNMVLPSAIPGTINFVPRNTPAAKQLDLLEELRVNYAIFETIENGGNCVVQSLYTAQDASTQLIYINNVLAVQEVIREIRTTCPKNRYSFQSGNDFSTYAKDVSDVLKPYKSHFSYLEFVYEQDDIMAAQKIFNGALRFAFSNWFQTEVFDIVIINAGDVAEESTSLF